MEKLWIDKKLREEEMVFLNKAITYEEQRNNNEDWKENKAGNVSRCNLIDKDNWFYETVIKKQTEKMFYYNWNNYRKYHIEKEESPPEFEMFSFWVNYQKKHEHVPIHNHNSLYSFVVFMKIPTHWEEQHVQPKNLNSHVVTHPSASDFGFLLVQGQRVEVNHFSLSSGDEGRMLFFPGWLQHIVYPFYDCEEERITISGNIQERNNGKNY